MSILKFKSKAAEARHAKWVAIPPHIVKPLRYIRDKVTEIHIDEQGQKQRMISPVYFMAKDFADAGDGAAVRQIAKLVYAENK